MLPEDGGWLADEDEMDSDEEEADYGAENGNVSAGSGRPSLQRSLSDPVGIAGAASSAAVSVTSGTDAEDDDASTTPAATPSASPSRTSRYGTYFHHPERRRMAIPGAFPTSGRHAS